MAENKQQLSFRDFSAWMKVITTVTVFFFTSGMAYIVFKAGAINEKFENMSASQSRSEQQLGRLDSIATMHSTKLDLYDLLFVDMAINVCELRAMERGEPTSPCQQIRSRLK